MRSLNVTVECPIHPSFRAEQVAGMFDLPPAERAKETFHVELPESADAWQIGLIVGPSGSGKTTVARAAFGGALYRGGDWADERAVVDGLGDLPIREVTGLFTAVGFSSPPSWLKPYRVLSGGERFRCDLARALARAMAGGAAAGESAPTRKSPAGQASTALGASSAEAPLVVFDEFTSVVDRHIGQIGSAAIAKAIRGGRVRCRFVAVTCHYDVAEWLSPDWVLDMATGRCQWRGLRRPPIALELYRCGRSAWRVFARHHYLSGDLSPGARCFVALWNAVPVSFCATLALVHRRGHWRITRMVTLPDYQGIGIGMRVAEAVCDWHRAVGCRINVTASHPAVIAHCGRSPRWRLVGLKKAGAGRCLPRVADYRGSVGRAVVSFEYEGGP